VSDPPDFSTDLLSTDLFPESEMQADRLQDWLVSNASAWGDDPAVQAFLTKLASVEEPRDYLMLFSRLLDVPLSTLEKLVDTL
jgi:hypothetical protein